MIGPVRYPAANAPHIGDAIVSRKDDLFRDSARRIPPAKPATNTDIFKPYSLNGSFIACSSPAYRVVPLSSLLPPNVFCSMAAHVKREEGNG